MEKNRKNSSESEADYVADVQRQRYKEGTKEANEKKVIYLLFEAFLLVIIGSIVAFCSMT